jgi:hypothetical protein
MIDLAAISSSLPEPEAYVRLLGLVPHRGPRRDTVRVLCPWHNEKAPSCDVTARDGRIVARCRACNAGGDHLHLAAAAWGRDIRVDFRGVALDVARLLGVTAADTPRARPKPQDPLVVLARALERAAEDMLDGRELHPKDVATICAATDRQAELALRLIKAALHRRRVRECAEEVVDLALDRLADAYDAEHADCECSGGTKTHVHPKPSQQAA